MDSTKVEPDLGSPTIKISLKNLNLGLLNEVSKLVLFLIVSESFINSLIFDGLDVSFKSLPCFKKFALLSNSLSLWKI